MRYFALLKDSLKEALDKKTLYVLGAISFCLILMIGSLRFERSSGKELLQTTFEEIGIVELQSIFGPHPVHYSFNGAIASADDAEPQAGEAFKKGYRFVVEFDTEPRTEERYVGGAMKKEELTNQGQFLAAVYTWQENKHSIIASFKNMIESWAKGVKKDDGTWVIKSKRFGDDEAGVDEKPAPSAAEQVEFLETFLRRRGFEVAKLEAGAPDEKVLRFQGRCGTAYPFELHDVQKLGIFFGAAHLPMGGTSTTNIVFVILKVMADWVAGIVGIFISILITAGTFPDLLKKGTLDLLLTKPISRPLVYIYKFLGGSLFVLLNAIVLVGGSWLALSLVSGWFNWWYLCSIGVLMFFFLTLYAVSACTGVLWKNWIVSLVATLIVWFSFTILSTAVNAFTPFEKGDDPTLKKIAKICKTVHKFTPKTGEITDINIVLMAKGLRNEEASAEIRRAAKNIHIWEIVLPSVGFIVFFVGLGAWIFSRRDY